MTGIDLTTLLIICMINMNINFTKAAETTTTVSTQNDITTTAASPSPSGDSSHLPASTEGSRNSPTAPGPPTNSKDPIGPLIDSKDPTGPPTNSTSPTIPPTNSTSPTVPPTNSTSPTVPPTNSTSPTVPPTNSTSPTIPPTNSTSPTVPPTNSTSPTVPPTNSTSPTVPPTNSTSPTVPPTNSTSPTIPPTNSTSPTVPPTNSTSPTIPPTNSTSPTIPPTNSTSPTVPPTNSTSPTVPPTNSTSPTRSPTNSTSPTVPLTNSTSSTVPPTNSPAPTGRPEPTANTMAPTKGSSSIPKQSYPTHEPNWGTSKIPITLTIFVNSTYTKELSNTSSSKYQNYKQAFTKTLTRLYSNIDGFQAINITGFFNGSIECRFDVLLAPNNTHPINQLFDSIKAVNYSGEQFDVQGTRNLEVEIKKTNTAIDKALEPNHLKEALQKVCMKSNVCQDNTVCVVENQHFTCTHKCNTNNICSKNGECYLDTAGDVQCRCKKDSTYVYSGHTCKEKVLVFFNGKNTTIIGACAGAVIAFLLLLVIYLGARWRRKRTPKPTEEKFSDPDELRRENSQIENVPMDGVEKTNPMYQPDPRDEGHGSYQPGEQVDRNIVYEDELAYNEGRYYRVLKDPESKSKAFVYQPSNISRPEQRTSTASKFDDLDSKPLSYHLQPEIEQRSFHDMVDTENPYSIRRPQIMRSTVNSDGYR